MAAKGRRSNAPWAVFARRNREKLIERLDHVFGKYTVKLAYGMLGTGQYEWFRRLPLLPRALTRWTPPAPWPDPEVTATPTPPALQSYAGTQFDREAVDRAYAEKGPLINFNRTHIEAVLWTLAHSWTWLVTPYPRLRRAIHKLDVVRAAPSAPAPAVPRDPAELARMIRTEAKRLGISEVGFTKADPAFTFAGFENPGDANIIVCAYEQDYRRTNTAPSSAAERAAFRGYAELNSKIADLVSYVKALGYEARPNDWGSQEAVVIKYGVAAGMGQLGLNGQLLTPMAGSRCRLGLITTMAPMELGEPVDHGVPRICDECQLCVRRCPTGAIPVARKEKRGVMKASINPERCFPMVAQAHGCAVCMKVCPVQRYGLKAVKEHYADTGQILGKGTDELEGYVWPIDGRYYGPGEKPGTQVIRPPGWVFERDRTAPPGEEPAKPAEEPVSAGAPADG